MTENMEVVALCLAFRDLLRQGLLEELGWGMAEEVEEEVELVLLKVDVLLDVLMAPECGACSAIPGGWLLTPSGGSVENRTQMSSQKCERSQHLLDPHVDRTTSGHFIIL